jgi:hypothetical protein
MGMPSGQCLVIVLAVPYNSARVLSDPPAEERDVAAVDIDVIEQQLRLLAQPLLDRCYRGE